MTSLSITGRINPDDAAEVTRTIGAFPEKFDAEGALSCDEADQAVGFMRGDRVVHFGRGNRSVKFSYGYVWEFPSFGFAWDFYLRHAQDTPQHGTITIKLELGSQRKIRNAHLKIRLTPMGKAVLARYDIEGGIVEIN
jgi:hypothetical protein